jgi:hypothetical protein
MKRSPFLDTKRLNEPAESKGEISDSSKNNLTKKNFRLRYQNFLSKERVDAIKKVVVEKEGMSWCGVEKKKTMSGCRTPDTRIGVCRLWHHHGTP